MDQKIRVAILDDHPSIIDGYLFRLKDNPEVHVVGTGSYGHDLEPLLAEHHADLLILDVSVPTSFANPNPYPVLHVIPKLLQEHTELAILIVSMHNQSTLIKAVMDAGASGYILKDDQESIQKLGEIIVSVANGGIYFSQQSYQQLLKRQSEELDPSLTPRQKEVLSLCASRPDLTTAKLADALDVSPSTLRNLLSNIYVRLDVRNRQAAIAKARQLGLITPNVPSLEPGS